MVFVQKVLFAQRKNNILFHTMQGRYANEHVNTDAASTNKM